jgi:hypothetical protein
MHARIAELMDHLDRTRAALLATVESVPESRRNVSPGSGGWSPAQVLDHLAVVEAGSVRLMAKRIARAREGGLGPDPKTSSVLGALDGQGVASREQRWQAPEIVLPRDGATAASALASLRESRAALLELLRDADGLDLSAVRAMHTRLGDIDMYQWALFIGQHEARHTSQIGEMAAAARAAGSASAREGSVA